MNIQIMYFDICNFTEIIIFVFYKKDIDYFEITVIIKNNKSRKEECFMAKIASFMLSESSQNISNGQGGVIQQLTGPTIVLRPQFIPSNFSFSVSVGIRGINLCNNNVLHLVLKKPNGELLNDYGNMQLPVSPAADPLPIDYSGFVIGLDIRNVVIDQEGCYKMDVFLNEEFVESLDVPVFRRI